MKIKLLLLLFLVNFSSFAQTTIIPDPNFEDKLIALGIDNDGKNGYVLTSSIKTVSSLNVSYSSIVDLTGIQNFSALKFLYCNNNSLTNLDLSDNNALQYLYCHHNQLTNLNVSKNSILSDFDCGFNQLTNLDVSKNTSLRYFYCNDNQLTNLNVSNNSSLYLLGFENNQLTNIDISNNIILEHLICNNNQLLNLDVSRNTILKFLHCYNNLLTNLDVSKNGSLQDFSCYSNQLASLNLKSGKNSNINSYLNLTNNPNLSCIQVDNVAYSNANWSSKKDATATYSESCSSTYTLIPDINFENKLISLGIDSGVPDGKVLTANIALVTYLDVSNSNIADLTGIQDFLSITNLFCGSNQLTNLDVSKNKNLKQLSCGSNQLTNLDISKNIELTYLSCSINKLANLDVSKNTALTNLFCHTNLLTNLDVTNNPSLLDLYCDNNQLKSLDVSMNTSLMSLNCPGNQLTNLDVSKNTDLDTLSCYSNQLTNLDVKINTALTKLDCGSNQISTLDVSKNTALTFLGCNTSLLTTLDVSKNTALNLLDCRENKLTYLDVSKMTTLTELYCQSNQLTNLDISKNKALEFLNCSKNQLTTLDVSVNTALVGLYSNSNQLKNLNLKNGNNVKFEHLNLTNNPNLRCIQVDDINYSNANWSSKKDAMANFNTDCPDSNPYTYIPDQNFEQKLIDLGIDTDGLNGKITVANINSITSLDLSNSNIKDLTGIENFTALTILDCSNNQLITLDLSKNANLQILYVTGNPLVYLNLKNGNNQNLIVESKTSKKTANTQGTSFLGLTSLGCVKVDNVAYSNTNWSKIKETTTIYSETCTLGLEDSEFNKAIIYPNPTKGEINILNIALDKATVYNSLGQLVKTFTLDSINTNNIINLSGLPKGVYYVYLISQGTASVKKVIVE